MKNNNLMRIIKFKWFKTIQCKRKIIEYKIIKECK